MTSIGMDTRIPPARRAVTMILALIDGVPLTRDDVLLIRDKLKLSAGRPKSEQCSRGHVKTAMNTGAKGVCLDCQRGRDRKHRDRTRQKMPVVCVCGHVRRDHEESRGECYHEKKSPRGVPFFDCECGQFREVKDE